MNDTYLFLSLEGLCSDVESRSLGVEVHKRLLYIYTRHRFSCKVNLTQVLQKNNSWSNGDDVMQTLHYFNKKVL